MYPDELKYTKTHEWIRDEGDGTYTVGVTAYAIEQLGDITYVDPAEAGTEVKRGDEVCSIESVKAVGDVYAPIAGVVAAFNDHLEGSPEAVQESPYEGGWLFRLEDAHDEQLSSLMDSKAYAKYVAGLAE